VSENKVRRIFGPKRDEVTGEWRKIHSEELHIFYSSPNITDRSNQGERGGQGMWHAWERTGSIQGFDGKAGRKETTLKT
jgi:hypothetical protein